MNTNSMTYAYRQLNANAGINSVLNSLNINNCVCPYELYQPKMESIKSFSFPLLQETYDALKSGKVVPVLINDPYKDIPKQQRDMMAKLPPYFFNFTTKSGNGFMSAINMDLKGGYKRDKSVGSSLGSIRAFNIDDRSFFHLSSLGYVINRLFELDSNGSIKSADDFCKQMASFYSILLGKCLDKNFSLSSTDALDYLHFLCACFCLEAMLGYSKKDAINLAKKIKFIRQDNPIYASSWYILDDSVSMMNGVDYKDFFPIDNFVSVLQHEFTNFRASRFNKSLLIIYFTNLYGLNSFFALESFIGLVTMYVLSRAKMYLYSDNIINKNMELIKNELNKTFNLFLSKR